jgi:CDP-glycerol glycerophosphotransferase (TagB/SpsB family)
MRQSKVGIMQRQSLGGRFAPYDAYVRQRELPLWDNTCLFESAVGKNINGNMFALMREMCSDEAYAGFEIVFAVTDSMLDVARTRLDSYGMQRVRLVIEESAEYNECLARAKYLWNDDTFPAYFTKRPGQVYVNTWHGSGPKRLGLGDISNSLRSFANVQKNLLTADYDLYPS